MQDNITDALIQSFERHYGTSWDDPSMRNERNGWKACWSEAARSLVNEISEAEQAAWHSGIHEGRSQKQCLVQITERITSPAPASTDHSEGHAYTVNVQGRFQDCTPAPAAFELPDGVHRLYAAPQAQAIGATPFQTRVQPWMTACFGAEISADRQERNHRFIEEALELVQANGCTQSEANQLVDYVFGRPVGEPMQEVGGVMVTLAALCLASGLDMHAAAETELARIWTKVDAIRAKQAAKPKHPPLPQAITNATEK